MKRMIVAVVVLVVAGCKKKDEPAPQPQPQPQPAPVAPLAIEDLAPEPDATFERAVVLVRFRTNRPARASVSVEPLDGTSGFRRESPEATEHRVELSDLVPGKEYRFRVEAVEGDRTARTEERRFSIRRFQGLVFVDHDPKFEIERADDQRAELRVRNADNREHAVRILAREVADDLAVGPLGPGSEDEAEPTRLEPGETRVFRLMLHASGAAKREYAFRLVLRDLERPDPEALHDSARARLTVRFPKFDVKAEVREAERNPSTLVVPVVLTNAGENIGDLTIEAGPALAGRVAFAPQYDRYFLASGASVRFSVIPVLSPGLSKIEGDLVVRGGGGEKRVPLRFAAPEGKRAYLAWGGTTDENHVCGSG
jgi:hypothetical protein